MATQYGNQGNGGAEQLGSDVGPNTGYTGASAGQGSGEGSSGARGGSTDAPNFGSARSDYGDLAYGGGLDNKGLGGKSVDDFSQGRELGSRGILRGQSLSGRSSGSSRGGANTALLLLYGVGIGAGLMYLLDPNQGRRRRALLRDKLIALSNDAGDALGSQARHLRNRAQGVIAEASSKFRSSESGNEQTSSGAQQQGGGNG